MKCGYCYNPATHTVRDEYYEVTDALAWMPICGSCLRKPEWKGARSNRIAPATADHFHVVGTKGFHPNNAWHHHRDNLYTLGGSAYSFTAEQLHTCYGPAQPYGRCMAS